MSFLYQLSFSIGYSAFQENDTEDSFLAEADQKMYLQKKSTKKRLYKTRTPHRFYTAF